MTGSHTILNMMTDTQEIRALYLLVSTPEPYMASSHTILNIMTDTQEIRAPYLLVPTPEPYMTGSHTILNIMTDTQEIRTPYLLVPPWHIPTQCSTPSRWLETRPSQAASAPPNSSYTVSARDRTN